MDPDEFSYLPGQAEALGTTAPPVRRETLTLDDGRELSALAYGDGPPTVTLLHGAGLNAHTFDATVLAAGVDALAIDLPGHGHSDWRADADYRPRTLAPDVIAALEAWTDRPQVLVGQSLGGLTAAAVAATRPDLVARVVVVDILPGLDPTGGPDALRAFFAGPTDWASRDELVDRAVAFGLGGADRADVERGVLLNSRLRPDGRVQWHHHFARLANEGTLARVVDPSGWDDLTAVAVPLTLVRAERGFLRDEDVAAFRDRMPTASVVTVPSGHNVQEELPRRLAEIIAEPATGTSASPVTLGDA